MGDGERGILGNLVGVGGLVDSKWAFRRLKLTACNGWLVSKYDEHRYVGCIRSSYCLLQIVYVGNVAYLLK